jgi:hypothetical protein
VQKYNKKAETKEKGDYYFNSMKHFRKNETHIWGRVSSIYSNFAGSS